MHLSVRVCMCVFVFVCVERKSCERKQLLEFAAKPQAWRQIFSSLTNEVIFLLLEKSIKNDIKAYLKQIIITKLSNYQKCYN